MDISAIQTMGAFGPQPDGLKEASWPPGAAPPTPFQVEGVAPTEPNARAQRLDSPLLAPTETDGGTPSDSMVEAMTATTIPGAFMQPFPVASPAKLSPATDAVPVKAVQDQPVCEPKPAIGKRPGQFDQRPAQPGEKPKGIKIDGLDVDIVPMEATPLTGSRSAPVKIDGVKIDVVPLPPVDGSKPQAIDGVAVDIVPVPGARNNGQRPKPGLKIDGLLIDKNPLSVPTESADGQRPKPLRIDGVAIDKQPLPVTGAPSNLKPEFAPETAIAVPDGFESVVVIPAAMTDLPVGSPLPPANRAIPQVQLTAPVSVDQADPQDRAKPVDHQLDAASVDTWAAQESPHPIPTERPKAKTAQTKDASASIDQRAVSVTTNTLNARPIEKPIHAEPVFVQPASQADDAKPEVELDAQSNLLDASATPTKPAAKNDIPTADSKPQPHPHRAEIVKQVAERIEFMAAAKPREGITIHLKPLDLGAITVVVKSVGDVVHADVTASEESVRASLAESREALSSALVEKGYKLASLEVRTASQTQQQSSNLPGQARDLGFAMQREQQQQQQGQRTEQPRTAGLNPASEAPKLATAFIDPTVRATRGLEIWI